MKKVKMGKRTRGCLVYGAVAALLLAAGNARANLRFLEPTADAGEIHAGVPLRHPFAFVNDGTEPVAILSLRASCGCLRPHVARQTWKPGDQGEVVLDVHTLGLSSGPHTWRVYVCYKIGEANFEASLQLTGQVITEVSVQPASLTVFAESAVGHEVLLTDLREHPLSIAGLQTSSPKLRGRLAGSYTDELGRQVRRIQVEVAADYPEGRHEEVLDIHTDDPSYHDLRVPVTIVKRSADTLTVMPARVEAIAAPGQELPSRIVLVRSGAGKQVVVDRIDTDDPAVACQWARGPGAMTTVRINVDRSLVTTPVFRATVRIHVLEPRETTLSVPVSCTLQGEATPP